jgi:ABC-type multidrug transport system fused ATPase/permease subunit
VFPYYGNIRWLGVQLQSVGAIIIFAASIFAVIAKDTISPSIVALSLTYALQVSHSLRVLVRFTSEVETNIVAVERIDEYSTVTQEAEWDKNDKIVSSLALINIFINLQKFHRTPNGLKMESSNSRDSNSDTERDLN